MIYTWASHLLTFGQYVIGGVLASAFMQNNLTPKVIGFSGVLVLCASLINQQYHPEVRARDATQKAKELGSLIRDSEDQLAIIGAGLHMNPNITRTYMDLALQISGMLNAIDKAGLNKNETEDNMQRNNTQINSSRSLPQGLS